MPTRSNNFLFQLDAIHIPTGNEEDATPPSPRTPFGPSLTSKFDEIAKAENLEKEEEILRLRKNLDQQLINFQDLITKLANKLQRQLLAIQNRSWEYDLEEGLLLSLIHISEPTRPY